MEPVESNSELETKENLEDDVTAEFDDSTTIDTLQIETLTQDQIYEEQATRSKTNEKKEKSEFKFVPMTDEEVTLMKQNAEMKCEMCSKELTSWSEAKFHYKNSHRLEGFIRCCGRKIKKKHVMIDHIYWHQDPNMFSCSVCGKVLLTRENMVAHEANHIPDEYRQFQCTVCLKKFGSHFALSNHKRLHKKDNIEASIPCPDCPAGRKYKTKYQLKLHILNIHKAAREFMCELCSKVLKSKQNLETHLKTHMQIRDDPINCKLCGHWIANKRRFAIHMSKHKQEESQPEGYECGQCGKKSKNKLTLSAHISYVHSTKKFPCEFCNKVFKHQGNLIEHQSQHTGDFRYSCPFCERTFKSSGNMHSHKKKMHPEDYAQLPLPAYLQPPTQKSDE